jgi:ubiquinone biosynthesis protein UbiJ
MRILTDNEYPEPFTQTDVAGGDVHDVQDTAEQMLSQLCQSEGDTITDVQTVQYLLRMISKLAAELHETKKDVDAMSDQLERQNGFAI